MELNLGSDVSSDAGDEPVENPKEQLMERFKQLRQWQVLLNASLFLFQ